MEPDSRAGRASFAVGQPFVTFENAGDILFAHSDAVVRYADCQILRRRDRFRKCRREFRSEGDAHLHVPLLRGVFQGVGDQVRQNLAELVDVHGDDEPFRREIQIDRDLFLAGIAGEAVHQPPDVGQNVLPADREGQRVVFDAAQRERLIDQIEQFLDIVVDQADQLPHPVLVGHSRQHVDRAVDQRQGSPQFVGDVREEVDLHVGELLLPFEFRARQLQFHLLPLPVQIEPVGEARAPDYDERIDEKGVPRQQRRGPDDDLQPPRFLVPEPVRIPRLQFEDVMPCRQVGVVGHAQVLDVLPFVIDIAAAQPVGETDLLRREERHGLVADVDVALLVPEHDAFGVVERLRQGARFRRRQGHAVDPDLPEHQRYGLLRDLRQNALRRELGQPRVAAEVERRRR